MWILLWCSLVLIFLKLDFRIPLLRGEYQFALLVIRLVFQEYLYKYDVLVGNVPKLSLNWIIWEGLFCLNVLFLPPDNY